MDSDSFDDVTRILTTTLSRRRLLQALGGTVAGSLLVGLPLTITHAAPPAAPPAVDLPTAVDLSTTVDVPTVRGLANAPNFELLGEVPASEAAQAATGVTQWRIFLRRGAAPVIRVTGVGPNGQSRAIIVLITDQQAKIFQLFELQPTFGGVVVRNQDVLHIGPASDTEQQPLFVLLAEDLRTQPIAEAARGCLRAILLALSACLAAREACCKGCDRAACGAAAGGCLGSIGAAIEACGGNGGSD